MKKVALIIAGGSEHMINNRMPKQFMLLRQKPVLYYTINSFMDAFGDMEIILVLPPDYIANGQEIVDGYFDNSRITLCAGGRTRFHSVQNGLELIKEECIIFVHDGIRGLVQPQLIRSCYQSAVEKGTAIPVTQSRDHFRLINENEGESTPLQSEKVRLVQSPQTFHSKILLPAYTIDYKDHLVDEAAVIEAFGLNVHLIMGDPENIKISTPQHLLLAEKLLEQREVSAILNDSLE